MKLRVTSPPELLAVTIAGVLFLLISLAFTWPMVTDLSGVCLEGDPYLNIVILDHVANNLFSPDKLFNAPFFYPYKQTLAFSEHYIALAPLYVLFKAIFSSSFASLNILLILSFATSGFGMYLLCRKGFGFAHFPSFLGGFIFAFCHYKVGHFYHLHLTWTVWIPLALLYLIKFLKKPSWKNSILVGLFLLLQFLSSLYGSLFLLFAIGIIWLFFVLADLKEAMKQHWKLLICVAVSMILVSPVLINYFEVKGELGLERNMETVLSGIGDIKALVTNSQISKSFLADWPLNGEDRFEGALMPGIIAILLAFSGVILFLKRHGKNKYSDTLVTKILNWFTAGYTLITVAVVTLSQFDGLPGSVAEALSTYTIPFIILPVLLSVKLLIMAVDRAYFDKLILAFLALGVTGIFLCLGPTVHFNGKPISYGLYWVVYQVFPFMAGFRVPARWMILSMISISALVALSTSLLKEKLRKPLLANILIGLMVLAAFYEYSPAPFSYEKSLPVKEAHVWLSKQKGDFAILEFPVHSFPADETEYMIGNITHGKKLINGYSGFIVGEVFGLATMTDEFPNRRVIDLIRSFPAKYLLVNYRLLMPEQKTSFRKIARQTKLFNEVAFIDEVGIYSINHGARGRKAEMSISSDEKEIVFSVKSLKVTAKKQEKVTLFANDEMVKSWKISNKTSRKRVDISQFAHDVLPTRLEFRYSMKPLEPVIFRSFLLPFNLELQIGGEDANLSRVIYNGENLPSKKGYNIYLLDEAGSLISSENFNTSWYLEESARLALKLKTLPGNARYLILTSKYDVSRNLSQAGVAALRKLGVAHSLIGKKLHSHVAIIDLGRSEVIFEMAGKDKIELLIGESHKTMGFNIFRLETSPGSAIVQQKN